MKQRLCAAAVCAAFGAGAMWSAGALAQSALDRAVSTGFLAGLDRAMKTPLEIVWLRAAADEALWKQAEFSGTKPIGRTAWRYVFGGSAQYSPPPNEVARLVVSTLNLPQGSLAAGRLDLRGTGRLYIVTPETAAPEKRSASAPDKVAMILAAGSTLTVNDALSPSIHVEIKAPETEPMLLGNLAASDLGKALALFVKPGGANALEASIDLDGKVALHGAGTVQLAALLPSADLPVQLAKAPAAETFVTALASPAIAPARPAVLPAARPGARPVAPEIARDFVAFAAVPMLPQAQFEPIALAALPSFLAPQARTAGAGSRAAPTADLRVDIAAVSIPQPRKETITLAALAGASFPQPLANAAASRAGAVPQASISVPVDTIAAASSAAPMLVAALVPAGVGGAAVAEPLSVAPRGEAKAQFAVDVAGAAPPRVAHPVLAALAPRVVEPSVHDKATPADSHPLVALAAPVSGSLEFAAAANSSAPAPRKAELAHMREEIEAEIERERERLAAQLKPQVIGAPAKRFVLGV